MEYKPCPFCGSSKIKQDLGIGAFGESLVPYGVECEACGASHFDPTAPEDGEDVEINWNTRPIEGAKDAEIAALKDELAAAKAEGERMLASVVQAVSWEGDEMVITINGRPVGCTISRRTGEEVLLVWSIIRNELRALAAQRRGGGE